MSSHSPLFKTMGVEFEIIKSNERGLTETPESNTWHSFSFGNYYNLKRLNFGTLRVFNEEILEPGKGREHSRENMEIITLVLQGAIHYSDSLGNQHILQAGQVQCLSAGKGVSHLENNASSVEKAHFLQIWIFPKERDLKPSCAQRRLLLAELESQFCSIVSPLPKENSLSIYQDAGIFLGKCAQGKVMHYELSSRKNGVYCFIIRGEVSFGGHRLTYGDAVQIVRANEGIACMAMTDAEVLFIEVGLQTL